MLNIKLSYPLENVCFTKFDLSVEQRRSFWKRTNNKFEGTISDGKVIFSQKKVFIKCEGKWYLTSGAIDLPGKKEK